MFGNILTIYSIKNFSSQQHCTLQCYLGMQNNLHNLELNQLYSFETISMIFLLNCLMQSDRMRCNFKSLKVVQQLGFWQPQKMPLSHKRSLQRLLNLNEDTTLKLETLKVCIFEKYVKWLFYGKASHQEENGKTLRQSSMKRTTIFKTKT